MSGRLQRPVVEQGAAARRAGRGARSARVSEVLDGCYVPLAGEHVPRAARQRRRRAGSPTGSTWAAPTASSTRPAPARSPRSRWPSNELALGHSDLVITGGVDTLNDIFMFMCFAQDAGAVADRRLPPVLRRRPTARCSARASACWRCGGSRTPSATATAIYAVIRGIGSSSDGRAKSIYAPSAAGAGPRAAPRVRAGRLRPGDRRAGRGARHRHQGRRRRGVRGAAQRLRGSAGDRQRCALGSVKSQSATPRRPPAPPA